MLCPKCNNQMHQSSIGLLVCLKCGYSQQPEESTQFSHKNESPGEPVTPLTSVDYSQSETNQGNQTSSGTPDKLTINDFVVDEPLPKRRLGKLAIVNKISNLEARQKKYLLTGFVSIFVFALIGSFLTFQDYQASSLLKQAVSLNQSSQFVLASTKLDNAKKHIKFPSTKKAIDKEIANNKRWQEFQKIQVQAENLMAQQKYSEALDLLYQISDDYPAYESIQKNIALAEARQTSDMSVSVLSDSESLDLIDGELSIGVADDQTDLGFSSGSVSYRTNGGPTNIVPKPVPPPPPIAPPGAVIPTPTYKVTLNNCQVNYIEFKDMYSVAVKVVNICATKFSTIQSLLIKSPYAPPHKIYLTTSTSVSGDTVRLNIKYLDDMGYVLRNLARLAMSFESSSVWTKEGLAYYIGFRLDTIADSTQYGCPAGKNLKTNAKCGATFLRWVKNHYVGDPLINSLSTQLRSDIYTEAGFWPKKTGKTLKELYAQCRNAACNGGAVY